MSDDRLRSHDPLVAALLTAAAAPAEVPLPGEAAALAAFRELHRPSRRRRALQSLLRAKVATAAVAGVVLAGGVATAATGTLPGVASITGHRHAHSHSTGPNSHAGTHPGTRGTDGRTGTISPSPAGRTQPPDTHGARVSDTAKSPSSRGARKGGAVCDVASNARCHAPTSAPEPKHSQQPRAGSTSAMPHGSRQQPRVTPTSNP